MGRIEKQWASSLTRRRAVAALGGMLAGFPSVLRAQLDPRSTRQLVRIPSLAEMVDVFDFEPVARSNISTYAWNWSNSAGGSEWSIRRNRIAFDWVDLVERPSGTVDSVDTSTEVLGIPLSHPIYISPNSQQGFMHPEGEVATFRAISATGSLMGIGTNTTIPKSEVGAAADGPMWHQSEIASADDMREFIDWGSRGFIFTVDRQARHDDNSGRLRWIGGNAGESRPPQPRAPRDQPGPQRYGVGIGRMWPDWDYYSSHRDIVPPGYPVLVKGILTAEDARIVVERGFDGVIVSNHGARTLEYVPSPLEALPEIVEAVAGRVPVLIDSGFRRGSDVFKALALGASAVGVGRATRWGLGAFGEPGVARVLDILQRELREAMVATGRSNIASIDHTAVRTNFI